MEFLLLEISFGNYSFILYCVISTFLKTMFKYAYQ